MKRRRVTPLALVRSFGFLNLVQLQPSAIDYGNTHSTEVASGRREYMRSRRPSKWPPFALDLAPAEDALHRGQKPVVGDDAAEKLFVLDLDAGHIKKIGYAVAHS